MKAIHLRANGRQNPMGISDREPFLSWQCEDGIRQTAYRILAVSGGRTIWDSGRVDSGKMHAVYEGTACSREKIFWQVRLWDENGEEGPYSEAAFFEMGLLSGEDWTAQWITPELERSTVENYDCGDAINRLAKAAWEERGEEGKEREGFLPHQPASLLRRKFTVGSEQGCAKYSGVQAGDQTGKFTVGSEQGGARLYITALGLYEASINGRRVGDMVLTPGTGNYACEIPFQTYDVTHLLREGENEISVLLGDGWYRSTSGVDGDRNLYGDTLALLCQLECGGEPILITDERWEASQDGPLRQNDMQQGEVFDARRIATDWHGVRVLQAAGIAAETAAAEDPEFHKAPPLSALKGMNTVPVKEKETFEGKLITTPDGSRVVDFGQNLAGYVEFWIDGKDGSEIRLWHGETLDSDGNFTQENFEDRGRHKENGTYQMISYICREGKNHYKPRFTIMGFRYAKIETKLDLGSARFQAHAVYSDMAETASFSCDNELVNQLFHNSVWSQKGNFCDVPTDCPTRERAAWTGDAGIFVETGLTLMDSAAVFMKWLEQCRFGQMEDGRLPNIAPPNNRPSYFSNLLYGSSAWGDACILVPYAIYQRTGDLRVLRHNYPMMKRWYAFLSGRADSDKQDGEGRPLRGIHSGIDYGEWCEPGTNSMALMQKGNFDVATAYLAYSGKLLTEIALLLGEREDAEHFAETADGARRAYRAEYTERGVIKSERQCQYIRPIRFGLLYGAECQRAADALDELVCKNGFHLNTGFLTTPDLCGVLAEYGHRETAYRVLLQDSAPGWLYAVRQGATTIWETWDGQASQNHYSYGAVSGWLISGVCGIRYRDEKTEIAPTPHPLLKYARAVYDSPAGRIESGWRYQDGDWILQIELPANLEAEVLLPDGSRHRAGPGRRTFRLRG